jgi:hypothetical protein
MKEIYSSSISQYCWLLKGILESEGINCEIKNDDLNQIIGGIPLDQTWPKLFVVNDDDIIKAENIIELNKPKLSNIPTFCPKCDSEEIELDKIGNSIKFDTFKCKKCNFKWNKGRPSFGNVK